MDEQVHELNVCNMWRDQDGILHEDFFPDVEVELDDVKEIVAIATKYFSGDNLVFVDISKLRGVSYDARNYLKTDEASANAKAVAYKVRTKRSQIIGNFLNSVNTPQFKTKLFVDDDKALNWLKSIE